MSHAASLENSILNIGRGGLGQPALPSLSYGLLGDAEDLAGDEKIGVVHGIDEKNVLHADPVALGNAAQGVALADGVDDWIGLDQDTFLWPRNRKTGLRRFGSRQRGGARGGRGRKIGEAVIK